MYLGWARGTYGIRLGYLMRAGPLIYSTGIPHVGTMYLTHAALGEYCTRAGYSMWAGELLYVDVVLVRARGVLTVRGVLNASRYGTKRMPNGCTARG